MSLKERARSYFRDARVIEEIPEEMNGLTGPQWAIVYRAVAAELNKCAEAEAIEGGRPAWVDSVNENPRPFRMLP